MTTEQCQALAAKIEAEADPAEKARLQAQYDSECSVGGASGGGGPGKPKDPGQ